MFKKMLGLVVLMISSASAMTDAKEWRFQVYLDDKEIGFHEFEFNQSKDQALLHSQASFEYRLLFVKLYQYRHENTETWQGECLTGIKSRTDANGEAFGVFGQLKDDVLVLEGNDGVTELPGCHMSFAYWNPAFLKQKQLINAQNGELVDVEFSEPEPVEIVVRGIHQPAWRYQLRARDMEITLWYSHSNEWLALESEASGGRRLRYVLN